MERITKLEAYAKMKGSKGQAFTVDFVKKDMTIRKINCKTNIKKLIAGDKGKGLQYNPLEKLLLPVVDLIEYARLRKEAKEQNLNEEETEKLLRRAWRSINLQTVMHLKIGRQEYTVI